MMVARETKKILDKYDSVTKQLGIDQPNVPFIMKKAFVEWYNTNKKE